LGTPFAVVPAAVPPPLLLCGPAHAATMLVVARPAPMPMSPRNNVRREARAPPHGITLPLPHSSTLYLPFPMLDYAPKQEGSASCADNYSGRTSAVSTPKPTVVRV
jgi:hypothetical protein